MRQVHNVSILSGSEVSTWTRKDGNVMDLSHTPRQAKEPWGQPDTEEEVILDQPDIEEEEILDQPDTEEEVIFDQPHIEEEEILHQPSTATPSRQPQVLREPERGRPAPAGSPPT